MDTENQSPNDIVKTEEDKEVTDEHLTISNEPSKTNGQLSASNEAESTVQLKEVSHRPSALAVFNRRVRLFFRPWRWRRKNRKKQRSISGSIHGTLTKGNHN